MEQLIRLHSIILYYIIVHYITQYGTVRYLEDHGAVLDRAVEVRELLEAGRAVREALDRQLDRLVGERVQALRKGCHNGIIWCHMVSEGDRELE